MVYNILLANNEKEMVDALQDILARQDNVNVFVAYSHTQARDILSKNSIDLAIIDVDMEQGDFGLLKTIKQTWEYCHVIIFTEVSDFEPIYTATRYPKTKYLLKSDGFTSLLELVSTVLHEINHERQMDSIVTQSRRQLMEANDIIKNDMFLKMVQEGDISAKEWAKKINMSIDRTKNFVLIIGSCKYGQNVLDYAQNNLRSHKIAKIIALNLNKYCKHEYLVDNRGNILYFIQPNYENEIDSQFITQIKSQLELVQENLNVTENISISFIVDANVTWDSLKEQIHRCTMMFSAYYHMDDSHFVADADSRFLMGQKDDDDILSSLPAKMIKSDIQKFLQAGDYDGCNNTLSRFKDTLNETYPIHSYEAQLIYLNAATAILTYVHSNNLVPQLATEARLYKLMQTETFQNWAEGFSYLSDLCEVIIRIQSKANSTYAKNLVDKVKAYIRKNIFKPDNITLPFIADMVHFNPSYLSRLFKKVTNISISDYIMECKLVQAKHLLADSDTKIQEIAENLGYTSQSNFARVFKKSTGVTPNDFRSQSNWNRHSEVNKLK